jgi:signal transduction histidine kinase
MFNRLRYKITANFVALIFVLMVVVMVIVNLLVSNNTNSVIELRFNEARLLLDQQLRNNAEVLTKMGLVFSRAPRLLAAVSTGDHGTVLDRAQGFRDQVGSELFTVSDASGKVLARVHDPDRWGDSLAADSLTIVALHGESGAGLVAEKDRLYQVVTVPLISAGQMITGALRLGFLIDDEFAATHERLTGTDLTFFLGGRVIASSVDPAARDELGELVGRRRDGQRENGNHSLAGKPINLRLRDEDFRCAVVDLPGLDADYLIQRSIDRETAYSSGMQFWLILVGLISLLAASVVSLILARGIAQPITQLAETSSKVAGGELDVAFRTKATGEIGELAQAFNYMTGRLKDYLDELEGHRLNLERKVEERTAELAAANKAKSQFLANMSHELRTPMNSIIGFSELLAGGSFGQLNEKQERYVDNIKTSGNHLLNLINSILDLSKVEAGMLEIHPEEFSIAEALTNTETLVRESAHKKNIAIECSVDDNLSTILADPTRFRQILFNILSNAIKFTPEDGLVKILAEPLGETGRFMETEKLAAGDYLLVSVTDTGIGIAPEEHNMVWGEFKQVDSSYARKQEGTGLGLTLTRKLVEMQGGAVWFESEPEAGTTFFFVLPINGSDEATPE